MYVCMYTCICMSICMLLLTGMPPSQSAFGLETGNSTKNSRLNLPEDGHSPPAMLRAINLTTWTMPSWPCFVFGGSVWDHELATFFFFLQHVCQNRHQGRCSRKWMSVYAFNKHTHIESTWTLHYLKVLMLSKSILYVYYLLCVVEILLLIHTVRHTHTLLSHNNGLFMQ